MIPCVFRLTQPVTWNGRNYNAGKEAMLRLRGWPLGKFRESIRDGTVEYPLPEIDFYTGPYHERFWDIGLFTDHDVYFAIKENRILYGLEHPTYQARINRYLDKHPKSWMKM